MIKEDLYDVLIRMDSKYIDEGICVLEKSAQRKEGKAHHTKNNRYKDLRMGGLCGVATTIIAIICIISIIVSICTIDSGNKTNEKLIQNSTAETNTIHIPVLRQNNLDSLTGSVDKESRPAYFTFITVPSVIKNSSEFNIDCSFGLEYDDPIFTFAVYHPEEAAKGIDDSYYNSYYIIISNRIYDSSAFFSKSSDCFSFYGESGEYKKYVELSELESSFAFDAGREVVWKDKNTATIIYNNVQESSLPYKISVPTEANEITANTKGFIYAGITRESKPGCPYHHDGNGTYIYYYSTGDYIGFGATEEEAFDNAFHYNPNNKTVDTDNNPIPCEAGDSFCDDHISLYPINITKKYRFERGERITVLFELRNGIDGANYELTFSPNNISNINNKFVEHNNKKYYEISFLADPNVNGTLDININVEKAGRNLDVFKKGITIYTVSSSDYTFISVASMETAMKLAGQLVMSSEDPETLHVEALEYTGQMRPAPIAVTGTVLWTDSLGNTHPARGIKIDIYKNVNGGGVRSITTVTTNVNGVYQAILSASANESYTIYGKVRLNGSNVTIYDSLMNEYTDNTSVLHNVSAGSNKTIPTYLFSNIGDLGSAASVHQGISLASEYIKTLENSYYQNINVVYPSSDNATAYTSSTQSIRISASDAFDWDVLEHEYGHYVADTIGINIVEGSHKSIWNLCDHYEDKNYGARLAWSEGFATYFAINLQKEMNSSSLNIPNVGDTCYTDIESSPNSTLEYNLEYLESDRIKGEGNEASIAAALYDLTDTYNALDYDYVYCASGTIWGILKENQSNSFSEFVSAFYNSTYGAIIKLNYGYTLTHFKMAASLNAPTGVTTSTPYFYWTTQGGSSFYPNNKFNLCFYNSSYTKVLSINNLTTDHVTLTANQWNSVKQQCGATIYCCVETYQSDPTQTGPYYSNLISIDNPNTSK